MRVPKALTHPVVVCALIAHVVLGLIAVARESGGLVALELIAYDLSLRARPAAVSDPRIAVVQVTEADIHHYGFPLSDEKLAEALERLSEQRPRAIGVDIYRDVTVPPGAARLDAIMRKERGIVWVSKFGDADHPGLPPPRVLADSYRSGFNDLMDDPGGTVRRGLLFLNDDRSVAFSLPLRLALRYFGASSLKSDSTNQDHARLGATTVVPLEASDGSYVGADARGYQFLLDFGDMPGAYLSFTLAQVLNGDARLSSLRDRIVLIGSTAKSVNDFFYTPYSAGLGPDQRMYGVELHARVASQLLRFIAGESRPVRTLSDKIEYAWIWLWCLAGALAGGIGHSIWRFFATGVLGLLVLAGGAYTAILDGLWIPAVPPALGFVGAGALAAAYISGHFRKEQELLMNLFSRRVSTDVATHMWRERELFMDGGRPKSQELVATVLATDIEGFTTISERLEPPQLMQWLNEYMEAMARQVSAHQGIVDKYIGDAVMAVFGIPIARRLETEIARDAENAVRCALAMDMEILRLNREWTVRGLPPIGMRAGIFTGPLVAGSLGSAERLEYTVIGDTVNTAFRLESLQLDGVGSTEIGRAARILIGESTRALLGDRFLTRPVGEIALKGKDRKIMVHRVIGAAEGTI